MSDAHDWMDMGKLRLSWGTNGNREFGDVYSTLSNLSLAGGSMVYYQNGNSNVVNPLYMSRLAAPNLEWEKTKAWNIGLDFSFLNGRLTANMDYYLKKTTDMIMSQRLPSFSGFGSIMANLGEVQNQGFEIALNSTNIQNRNFTWNTSVGFSINKNKINQEFIQACMTASGERCPYAIFSPAPEYEAPASRSAVKHERPSGRV